MPTKIYLEGLATVVDNGVSADYNSYPITTWFPPKSDGLYKVYGAKSRNEPLKLLFAGLLADFRDEADGTFADDAALRTHLNNNTSSTGFKSGGGSLTLEQQATLEHFVYNPMTDKLEADRSIETILASFLLGNEWKISSGFNKLAVTNISRKQDSFPISYGFLDQSIPANQDGTGIIDADIHKYDDLVEFAPNGTPDASVLTTYDESNIIGVNLIIFSQEVIAGEAVDADDVLLYQVFRGADDTGPLAYEQRLSTGTYAPGDTIPWTFENPLTAEAGTQNYVRMLLAKGGVAVGTSISPDHDNVDFFSVRAADGLPNTHYINLFSRTYTSEKVATEKYVDDNSVGYILATWGANIQTLGRHPAINSPSNSAEITSLGIMASIPVPASGILDTITYYNNTGDNTTEFQIIKNGVVAHTFTCVGPYGAETGINVPVGFAGSVPDNVAIRYSAGTAPSEGLYTAYVD